MCNYGTATSEFLIDQFKEIGVPNRIKIVNGVYKNQFQQMDRDSARKTLGIPANKRIILTFGNTSFKERTIYLFRTFEKIHERDPEILLYMNFDAKALLAEQASGEKFNKSMFEKIVSVGYLDKPKLSLYLGATDFVLFNMGDTTLEKACFPTRIGTYLNGERIIITNKTNTEACNILEKYNCAVIGKDFLDIAEKTIELFNDDKKRKIIEDNVRKAKNELMWENLVIPLIDFYKMAIEEKK